MSERPVVEDINWFVVGAISAAMWAGIIAASMWLAGVWS